ncbi:hypothetical protein [Rufibacter roseus]|uniref:Uncharacterized protein n=1 Tax=Rufibacter roseus TaxID=1567108 RepID=A0ABW2DKV7_9BACT|nr:hypothetical protein [Rufibacter roseus]
MRSKSIGAVFVLALVAVVFFFWKANDHQECSTVSTTEIDSNGCTTVVETHVCHERFNI